MCGIIGGLGKGAAKAVSSNLHLLERRGPDSSKILNLSNGLTLGAARLAMTDPHERSNQPMIDSKTGNTLVFNGEVYNFKIIRNQLISRGMVFETESDTEVVLKALSTFGPKITSDFEGMFAFAFYEKNNNKLFLARDYLGKKPLYYYIEDQKIFFSSQVKLIKNYIGKLSINLESVNTYLQLGYLIDPDTMFQKVFSVMPGEILTLNLNNISIESSNLFTPRQISQPDNISISSCMEWAISERVAGHSKFAISLSGGVDSTLIALESKRLGLNPSAYTLRWNNSDKAKYNYDALHSEMVAAELGLEHQVIEMPPAKKIPSIIDDFVSAMDQPNSNPTGISMIYLYSQIAKDGHRLVLTGDGGDEVFGGYDRYEKINKLRRFPKYNSNLLKKAIIDLNQNLNLVRKLAMAFTPTNQSESWLYWHLIYTRNSIRKLWEHDSNLAIKLNEIELSSIFGIDNKCVSNIMFRDLRTWLSMESNRKLDCISMWNSIEARSPFQSERVIGLGYNLMKSTKFSKIKKEILFDSFPRLKTLPILKSKTGFISPVGYWLRNNEKLIDYSIKSISEHLPLKRNELNKLIKAPENGEFKNIKILWSLIILNKWLDDNI